MAKDPTGHLWARGSKEVTRTGDVYSEIWHAFPVEYAWKSASEPLEKSLCGKKFALTSAWRTDSEFAAMPAARRCPACVRKA